jgi:tetratricopeptide (TPR) repeat protein
LKKWAIFVVVVPLLAVAVATHFWGSWLIRFTVADDKTVDAIKKFVELLALLSGFGIAIVKWVFGHTENSSEQTTLNSGATGHLISPGVNFAENAQVGGDVVGREKNVVSGDLVGGDKQVAPTGDIVHGYKIVYPSSTAAALASPFQLPNPPDDFTGREAELRELRDAIEKDGVHISGLQGRGGVGKTALALKLARELAPKFPDAQMYLDLKGVSEKPLSAAEALAHVVRSFHPDARLPEREDDLQTVYNTVLHEKRVLLLMDNARDAAQVQPLVPPRGCTLLVTSRNHFYLAGLHTKDLNVLPEGDAEKLLLHIASRVDGEATDIARMCGYLPQALRLAATAIAERRDLSPSGYRQKLADEKQRLELLGGGDKGIEASINLSYDLFDLEVQARWRMLGVFPNTFDAAAVGTIWEDEAKTESTLSDLLKLSMLEWDETASRYRLHDLMRVFARSKLSAAEWDLVRLRHAKHYLGVLSRAEAFYEAGGESITRGLALFDLEWGNIQAGQAWAAADLRNDHEAVRLRSDYAGSGVFILKLRQPPTEGILWGEAGLEAARTMQDRAAEGHHLANLGLAYYSLGEYRHAIVYHGQHLAITHDVGDRKGEGYALNNLGIAYYSLGDYRQAIECHEQNLTIARDVSDRKGEGYALGNLGTAYYSLGDYPRAIAYYEQYFAIARESGDRQGEGQALSGLGVSYYSLGDYSRAIEQHDQHFNIAREIGDRQGEGSALGNLGLAYYSLGDHQRAIGYHEQNLAIARQIGDRQGEGRALNNLGIAYYFLSEYSRAMEYHKQRLAIARQIGDREGEGSAHWNMSLVLQKLGQRNGAIEHAEAALQIYDQVEAPNREAVRSHLAAWRAAS